MQSAATPAVADQSNCHPLVISLAWEHAAIREWSTSARAMSIKRTYTLNIMRRCRRLDGA
jgi:hypothetical protein